MVNSSKAILFICFQLVSISLAAQSFPAEKLTEEDGLSDNRITCFMKDHTGFLWIGTENGLNRYDGHEFKVYRPGQTQNRISHEHINDLAEDRHNRLWIATWSGLNVLDTERDSLFVFSPDDDAYRQKRSRIASSITWDIYIDKKELIWLALDVRDLCYYRPSTETFHYFPWLKFVLTRWPEYKSTYKSIQKIAPKSDHELWLGTSLGLFSFNQHDSSFHFHGGDHGADFTHLQYDSVRQRVYFGQENLYRYDVQLDRLKAYTPSGEYYSSSRTPSFLMVPARDKLWMVDPETDHAYIHPVNERRLFSIHHEKVHAVFQEGDNLWLGTTTGVQLYNKSLSIFPFVKVFPDTLNQSSGNVYHVLDHAADDLYYVSSYAQNCLLKISRSTGKQERISFIQGFPLVHCTKTYEDRHHRLWILTDQNAFVSDNDHRTFRRIPPPDQSPSFRFTDILEDKNGLFWISSLQKGVYQLVPEKNEWKLLQHKPDGLFATRPTALLADPAHNALWIADFSFGVFEYDYDTKQFTYNGMDTNDPKLLQSSLANALTLDRSGQVWVATTSGGVSKYIDTEKRFVTFSMQTGLPENTIHSAQADHNGNIWLATSKGLTCIDPKGKVLRHYDKNSGLPFSDFSTPFSINGKGELLIGIANGFLKFHPDSLQISSPEFPVVITSWSQKNKPLALQPGKVFEHRQNEFTFTFSALTYTLPLRTTYFYILEGYDKTWVNAGNHHSAHYTNLGEGTYTFKVRAVDFNGRESVATVPITFTIRPPFWKQSWFLILLIGLVFYSLYWWTQRLQRKIQSQKILNQIATSLYGQITIEDVFWKVATSCVEHLRFEDCVVYLVQGNRLIQKAAAGPKSSAPFEIHNPIEIPVGKGIVGSVAQTGRPEIINNTKKDPRYIVDDRARQSEITVPIMVDGKVFGVIDSEHSSTRFYTSWHLHMLKEVASICSAKVSRYFIEEAIRSKVARDLHDDIGSTLSSIKIMSNIAITKNDPTTIQSYLQSIRENADTMQGSMSDMVWAINPENDTMEKVVMRMREFASEILEPLDIRYEVREDGDFSHTKLNLNTRKDFFLIFKEAINNAAKYSRCQNLTIELVRYGQGIILRIRDDGQGFDMNHVNGGNGLKNMKHRAANISGSLQIESVPGSGTSILLKAPIT